MNDSRRLPPPAPETAALESDDAALSSESRDGDVGPECAPTTPSSDATPSGNDDGWLPV